MPHVYVIVETRSDVDKLMQPFDIEQTVPTIVTKESLLANERRNLQNYLFHIETHFASTEHFYNQYNTQQQEHYRKHVLNDIPLYLSNTEAGDTALWQYIRYQYGIQETDILPGDKIIRRFNPNGKWDYYTIDQQPTSSCRVSDIETTLLSNDTTILLPNYLWINQNDPIYTPAIRQNFIDNYKNHRYALVEYHN